LAARPLMRRAMAGNCRKDADRDLLIYVSDLSGRLRHDARLKTAGNS
jgi:hypothetical protein